MNGKSWAIFSAIVVVLLGAMVYFAMQGRLDVSDVPQEQVTHGSIAAEERNGNIADHRFGNDSHKVVLLEYGDYQCPACASANATVQEIKEKYKDKLTFVFRNLPLVSIHPNARAAASAAEAAGLQGKYWEMHNLLYDNQDSWGSLSVSERGDRLKSFASLLTRAGWGGRWYPCLSPAS